MVHDWSHQSLVENVFGHDISSFGLYIVVFVSIACVVYIEIAMYTSYRLYNVYLCTLLSLDWVKFGYSMYSYG